MPKRIWRKLPIPVLSGQRYILLITCEHPVGEYLALVPQFPPQHHALDSLTIAKRNEKSVSQGKAYFHSIQKSFCEKLPALNTPTWFTAPPNLVKLSATILDPLLEALSFKLSRDVWQVWMLQYVQIASNASCRFWRSTLSKLSCIDKQLCHCTGERPINVSSPHC